MTPTMHRGLAVIVAGVLAAAPACRDEARLPSATPTAVAASATVVVRVDGIEAARIDAARLTERPRLGELVRAALGSGQIVRLDAIGRGGARTATEASRHEGQEPRLFLDEQGRPAFAWFRRAAGDEVPGTAGRTVPDVAAIEIHTTPAAVTAAAPQTLTVVVDGASHVLGASELAAIERSRTRGQGNAGGRRSSGWSVLEIAAAVAPGRAPVQIDVIGGSGEVAASLDAARLADAADPPRLKGNRRGALNLRSLQGPRVEVVRELRIRTTPDAR